MKNTSKYIVAFLLLSFTIGFFGCGDDDPADEYGKLEINFKIKYNSEPLVMLDRYVYPSDFEFFHSRFSFFMSELEISDGTTTNELIDVIYLNFTDDLLTQAAAENGTSIIIDSIPVGLYTNLDFNIGVPAAENSTMPADYPSDHPLSNSAEYWEAWNSYIFMKTEGKMDPDGDGSFDDGFALHLGSNDAFRSKSFSEDFEVQANQTKTITLEMDLMKMFGDLLDLYDIEARPQIHTLEHLPHALPLMDNLVEGIVWVN